MNSNVKGVTMNTTSITTGVYPTPDSLITAITQVGECTCGSPTQLERIEQIYQHSGGNAPFETTGLFGTHHGPARITVNADSVRRIIADMASVVRLNAYPLETDAPDSAVMRGLGAIKFDLQRLICILRHLECTGLTIDLGIATAA
jgi:hypothetical protein